MTIPRQSLPADRSERTWPGGAGHQRPARHPSAGLTLAELVVVLAAAAIVLGASALWFKPMAQPVRKGGELVEGLLKRSRAASISTTSVHRVRPLTDGALVVESAANCSGPTWAVEEGMDVVMPAGVTFSDTAWSVCFNGRGVASENLVITFDHAKYKSRRLEVLHGGSSRWLE